MGKRESAAGLLKLISEREQEHRTILRQSESVRGKQSLCVAGRSNRRLGAKASAGMLGGARVRGRVRGGKANAGVHGGQRV